MANELQVTSQFDDDETHIEYPDEGITETAEVTAMGDRLYRLDTVPVFVESVRFGDIIEAELLPSGVLRFCRVAHASTWQIYDFLLSEACFESPKFASLTDRVTELRGHWERVFGGMLFICLPSNVDWDPTPDIKCLLVE